MEQESVAVGIRTTTLKEIEDKDHFEKHIHETRLFNIGYRLNSLPKERFLEIPENVPYTFGIGGGLHVLYDLKDNEPEWKTIKWEDEPIIGHSVGKIYFKGSDHAQYVKIADNETGSWVWQKLVEEEQLSWKTGSPEWDYKLYFQPEARDSVSLNNSLNENGYSYHLVSENEDLVLPEELKKLRLESQHFSDHTAFGYLIYDPDRTEVLQINTRNVTAEKEQELEKAGYQFMESNIARSVFVRSKKR